MAWEGITFYWKHVLANLAATSTDIGYDVANILDRLDDTRWQAANTVTPMYININSGPGGGDSLIADFFGMGGHNFGTIGANIMLQYSNDNFSVDINDAWDRKISEFATSVFDISATSPRGVSYASNRTLWICDAATNKIYNVKTDGTFISSFATSVYDVNATNPSDISYASNNTLWITDLSEVKIYNVELDGTFISSFATSVYDAGATFPTGISYASNNTLWITDAITDKIYNIKRDGTSISSFLTSVYDAGATSPQSISYASNNTLWITDANTSNIYNVETDGTFISFFETSEYDINSTFPNGISYASDGNLWVSDSNSDKIYNVSLPLPPNDKTFVEIIDSVFADYWRLKITGSLSDKPYITHCYWGEKTELGFAEDLGDPDAFLDHDIVNFSEEGDLLGVYGTWKEREIIFRFVFKDTAFWQMIVDWRENIDLLRFFMSWEKGEYPTENWLVSRKKGKFRNPLSINGLWREITLSLTGKKEQ